jgi:hypothetical protein
VVGRLIWALLAVLGVPLWFCAIAIGIMILRNRSLRGREGDVPARMRRAPDKRWVRGHGLWVHDVWSFRGSPAAWNEQLIHVHRVVARPANEDERRKLRGLTNPVIATFSYDGGSVEVATPDEAQLRLMGPFVTETRPRSSTSN